MFKRPLFIAVVLYVAALALLKTQGFFRVEAPPAWKYFAFRKEVRAEGTVLTGFSSKRAGDRYWMLLDQADGRSQPPVRVMAYVNRRDVDTPRLRPGSRVVLRGRLRMPLWPRNPGGFDERSFLEQRGAALVLHAREIDILPGSIPFSHMPWSAGESVHRSLHAYFSRRFPGETGSIIEGILLGYKGALSPSLSSAIQDAGVMHLLTPSGAKVTVLLAAVFLAAAALGLSPAARWGAAALAGGGYLLVVGPEPPYTRAYGMALAAMAGAAAGRGSSAFSGWLLSAMATLLVCPRALFSAGFQLTYLAMLGIIIALPRWRIPRAWPLWARTAATAFAICLIVQLMLWPTFAAFFGRGSLAGFFVNAAVVPASPALMAASALAWAADAVSCAPAEAVAAAAAGALARGFAQICIWAARCPYAAVDLAPPSAAGVAGYYLGVLGVLVLPEWKYSLRLWACAAAVGLAAAGWRLSAPARLRAVIFAPPDARGMLVAYPDGRRVLVDAGIRPSAMRQLRRGLGLGSGVERIKAKGEPDRALEFRHGEVLLRWEHGGVLVLEGGKVEYCIMAVPPTERRCPSDRTFAPRWQGAAWVTTDGQRTEIETQKERHSHGRRFS